MSVSNNTVITNGETAYIVSTALKHSNDPMDYKLTNAKNGSDTFKITQEQLDMKLNSGKWKVVQFNA